MDYPRGLRVNGMCTRTLFFVVYYIYNSLLHRESEPDRDGFFHIKPGPASWLFCLICICCGGLFSALMIMFIFVGEDVIFWLLLGLPITLMFGYGAYFILFTRLSANDKYVMVKSFKGWRELDWHDVEGQYYHWILGNRIHIKGQKPIPVWVYGFGQTEVSELFTQNEKPFEFYR